LLKIIRHEWAIPQYEADSGERFEAVAAIEKQYPGLIIGGNLRNGIGMADRIQQARMLADAVSIDENS
jgi:oxygen-dependent protoporphyrinogen oxidase